MRALTRGREKRQLSLDDRQVAAFALCALLLLSGVFSIGVLVGRRTTSGPPPAAGGDLAALDVEAKKTAPAAQPKPAAPEGKAQPQPAVAAPEKAEPVRAATVVSPPQRTPTVFPPPPPERPVQAATAQDLPAAPPARDAGAFTVQVGASRDRGEASRLVGRARGAGLRPYVVQATLGAKGTWYRVRVGAFHDKDSANRFRKDVERELRLAAVVMPTR